MDEIIILGRNSATTPSKYFTSLAKRLFERSEASLCASMGSVGWLLCFGKATVHTFWVLEINNGAISKVPRRRCRPMLPVSISNHRGSFGRLTSQRLRQIRERAFCHRYVKRFPPSDDDCHVILHMWSCFSNLMRRSISVREMRFRISNARATSDHNW
jgi:hypothetical protein